MMQVLLVDDEQIIRDGIARLIPWERYGLELVGVCENGLAAWELICAQPPQIVITDIKMPGLDGLGLIRKVHERYPRIAFIVLSGYGEFELAKEAMAYGVKHYLLKPCNERRIGEALEAVRQELQENAASEALTRRNRELLEQLLPLVKEQFIQNYLAFGQYPPEKYQYYTQLLELEEEVSVMALVDPAEAQESPQAGNLVELIGQAFQGISYHDVRLQNLTVMLFASEIDRELLLDRFQQLQQLWQRHSESGLNIAYSDPFDFLHAPEVFRRLSQSLKQGAASRSGRIVSPQEQLTGRSHKIVETMQKYVLENLGNEELSLKWLAGEVVFMNEGYLSKLFLKETGEKFSHYLMRVRMDRAKELLETKGGERVCEVAQSIGLGNNPQYFSQLFKKYTGRSPSDFKRIS